MLNDRSLSRRQFLDRIAATLAAGALGPAGLDLLNPAAAEAATLGPTLPPNTPVLVMIELAGGNDILNTHVPHGVSGVTELYRAARPGLAIRSVNATRPYVRATEAEAGADNYLPPAFDLDGQWGLHASLPWLANRWWTHGDVAIVQGVGENVAKDMSHFAAMLFRWAGAFSGPNMTTGWLGRYNDRANRAQPLGGISLTGLSQALASPTTPAVSIVDLGQFDWRPDTKVDPAKWQSGLIGLGSRTIPAGYNKVAKAAAAIADADRAFRRVRGLTPPAVSGWDSLAGQLMQAATLINAGIPCQTYVSLIGTFDTHGQQAYSHWDRLRELDLGLEAFFSLIDAGTRGRDVFVLVTSEFGRQVTENAGGGTDHGRASSAFLIGGGVAGGLHGRMPSLAPSARYYDSLVPTVDFRRLWATILNRLSGDPAAAAAVLGATFAPLGVFN